ncbi:MAG: STAS domain-containing protein, partial [Myxococcota bacterium]
MNISYVGDLTRPHMARARAELWSHLEGEGLLFLDLGEVEEVDSAGAALLSLFGRELEKRGRALRLTGASDPVRQTLDLFPFEIREVESSSTKESLLYRI